MMTSLVFNSFKMNIKQTVHAQKLSTFRSGFISKQEEITLQ